MCLLSDSSSKFLHSFYPDTTTSFDNHKQFSDNSFFMLSHTFSSSASGLYLYKLVLDGYPVSWGIAYDIYLLKCK